MTVVTQTAPATGQTPFDLDATILEVEEQMGLFFGRARLFFKEAAAQIHPDLQPIGYKILSAIVRLGETNAHVLAEQLETDKSVLSRQLRTLEEIGMISSRADERDGRARVLAPTEEALRRVQSVRASRHEHLTALLASQPEDDVRAFASVLRELAHL